MLIDVLLLHSWIHLQELVPYASLQYCHQIPVHEFSGSPSSLDWRELKEFLPRLNLRENSIVYFLVYVFLSLYILRLHFRWVYHLSTDNVFWYPIFHDGHILK